MCLSYIPSTFTFPLHFIVTVITFPSPLFAHVHITFIQTNFTSSSLFPLTLLFVSSHLVQYISTGSLSSFITLHALITPFNAPRRPPSAPLPSLLSSRPLPRQQSGALRATLLPSELRREGGRGPFPELPLQRKLVGIFVVSWCAQCLVYWGGRGGGGED